MPSCAPCTTGIDNSFLFANQLALSHGGSDPAALGRLTAFNAIDIIFSMLGRVVAITWYSFCRCQAYLVLVNVSSLTPCSQSRHTHTIYHPESLDAMRAFASHYEYYCVDGRPKTELRKPFVQFSARFGDLIIFRPSFFLLEYSKSRRFEISVHTMSSQHLTLVETGRHTLFLWLIFYWRPWLHDATFDWLQSPPTALVVCLV